MTWGQAARSRSVAAPLPASVWSERTIATTSSWRQGCTTVSAGRPAGTSPSMKARSRDGSRSTIWRVLPSDRCTPTAG
ncbi:Uncharacterised protein [Bordetella pertussis]|nr:Uncharacterised protein [Bordetella pertussis]